ncbi:hypothetical protein A2567_00825 [Candidatus Azambacteria bacterium RIFOXYD1_FULL_42_11]|uniref:Tetratricopeptide repeat protein n=3 Tax=Candidatus Azamiibacteriota TaxID=1752741 RepID=A0A0G0ZD40_9BACT|nr:MAG: hypothetical protein UV10_C0001G0069 [Candidatus Azambacteria bacterium GW2011_GWA1_42_19]KKS75806.1 MAG: hypothetical protein UV48_C0006G0020 [Candidatus Azambacteria bacterium GW2011_GWA2_42_9]KKS88918.1 MAG: hypothetical protein UV62_C0001G0060 [Parcubacteria group bacterium GW2011_GWC1_43_11]OGD41767.1 MAG: hypothetical protein A2567_00825 [Candidatus Azambacteria bacterium RIFOXYD1_FULL_42_11]
MEEVPSVEKQENAEQRLARLLKEKGAEDPEARDLLDAWTREQEERVEEGSDPAAKIEFNLKRARLYFEAGYVEEALENFEAARMQAWNENRQELYEAIMAEMDTLESGLEK